MGFAVGRGMASRSDEEAHRPNISVLSLPQRGRGPEKQTRTGEPDTIDRGAATPPASEEPSASSRQPRWRIRSEARDLKPAAAVDAGPRRASSTRKQRWGRPRSELFCFCFPPSFSSDMVTARERIGNRDGSWNPPRATSSSDSTDLGWWLAYLLL